MASSRKFFHAKPSYIYRTPEAETAIASDNNIFEFDEADIYESNESSVKFEAAKKLVPSSRSSRKLTKKKIEEQRIMSVTSASLPVNIPDWSKVLKDHEDRDANEEEEDDEEYYGLIPPHEYLAIRRGASFSVHEGIGRTLKGRDLCRVRNAIWEKFGFKD